MDRYRKHIVVLRFSALGDVAVSAPLLKEYAFRNPDVRFTVVSQGFLKPLFSGAPGNVGFMPIDVKGTEKKVPGIFRFSKKIAALKPDVIADIHGVIRTRLISLFLPGIPVRRIRKERRERKSLVRGRNKHLHQLKLSMRKYEEVLVACGLEDLHFSGDADYFRCRPSDGGLRKIGIAPFAKHRGKMWPEKHMTKAVESLSRSGKYEIYLFGGKGAEAEKLEKWAEGNAHVQSVAGKFSLQQELDLIGSMDLMVCMDSANMHFASLREIPVISIWGATHPYAGFYGWRQDPADAIQLDMPCRPCSIYGNRECLRGDYACMENIAPAMLLNKINDFFNGEKI